MQSLFSENRKSRNNTVLVDENENIISEEYLESGTINNFLKMQLKICK